jgi:hypothetical protein
MFHLHPMVVYVMVMRECATKGWFRKKYEKKLEIQYFKIARAPIAEVPWQVDARIRLGSGGDERADDLWIPEELLWLLLSICQVKQMESTVSVKYGESRSGWVCIEEVDHCKDVSVGGMPGVWDGLMETHGKGGGSHMGNGREGGDDEYA